MRAPARWKLSAWRISAYHHEHGYLLEAHFSLAGQTDRQIVLGTAWAVVKALPSFLLLRRPLQEDAFGARHSRAGSGCRRSPWRPGGRRRGIDEQRHGLLLHEAAQARQSGFHRAAVGEPRLGRRAAGDGVRHRSEERRVGKEGKSRGWPYNLKK